MGSAVAVREDLMERVTGKIQELFVDLVTEDEWRTMVQSELDRFVRDDLRKLTKKVMEDHARDLLKAELSSQNYLGSTTYSPGGSQVVSASPAVRELMRDLAPVVMETMLAGAAQRVIDAIQQNPGLLTRGY